MPIRDHVRKLSSIFSRGAARRRIINELRTNPTEAVTEAITLLPNLRNTELKAASELTKILVSEAKANTRVRAALASKAMEGNSEAIHILTQAGYPIKELLRAINEARSRISYDLPAVVRNALTTALSSSTNLITQGHIIRAKEVIEETMRAAHELLSTVTAIKHHPPPNNEELRSNYDRIVNEANKAINHEDLTTALRETKALLTQLKELEKIDQQLTQIKENLRKAGQHPQLKPLINRLQGKLNKTLKQASNSKKLRQALSEAEQLNELTQVIEALEEKLSKETANKIISKITQQATTTSINQALQTAQTTLQYLQAIKGTNLEPQQITQYLAIIKKNYPKPVLELTIKTLQNPPTNPQHLQQLKQEILSNKPPYKTRALQKHGTPKQTIKQTLKQQPPINPSKQWESKALDDPVNSVALSPQGDKIAAGTGWSEEIEDKWYYHGRVVVSSSSGEKLWESKDLGSEVWSVAFSPDGTKIAAGGDFGVVIFSPSGEKLWRSEDLGGRVWSIAWSPQSDKIAVGLDNGYVVVFSLSGEKLWESEALGAWVRSVAWSPDGAKIAAGLDNGCVVVFSSSGEKLWEKYLGGWIESVAWSPQGDKAAAGGDFGVVVFSSSGKKLWESGDLGDWVRCVAFSPQGDKVVAGGDFKRVIVFSSSGEKLWESKDLGAPVYSVAFSPQGDKIVAGLSNGRVVVFGVGLGGLCSVVGGVLREGVGVSGLVSGSGVGGDGVCWGLRCWVVGECSGVGSLGGVCGDVVGFLCGGDYFGAVAALGFAVEAGLGEVGLYDLWFALTMGWGAELSLLGERVSRLAGDLGVDLGGDSLLDWFADELLAGGPALKVADRVRDVLNRLRGVLAEVKSVRSDRRFREFVRASFRGGFKEFVNVLEAGLRFLKSPRDVLKLRASFTGAIRAGVFSTAPLRLCNESVCPVVITSVGVGGEGVRGDVAGSGTAVIVGAGECREFSASLKAEYPGDVPVKVSVKAELPGRVVVERSVSTVVKVEAGTPRRRPAPSLSGAVGSAPQAAPPPARFFERPSMASVFVGKVFRLGFREPEVQPLPKPIKLGGLEVRGLIGLGGFAVALLGVDEVGRSYVVKVPREVYESLIYGVTLSISGRGVRAFEREFEILKGLNHTHLIKVVSGGVIEGRVPYIVMEYCGNGSLRGVLESEGRLRLEDAALLGVQVADALNYLHSRGIAHRDLKPENVLFTGEGLLKVSDFNIAKIMRTVSPTSSRRSAYTPGYAAPEQFLVGLGRSGPWSDVWALGTILYEALVGEPPFDPWEYEDAVREGEADLSKVPGEVSDLIRRMLSVNPKERPTAKEVEEELAEVLTELMRK